MAEDRINSSDEDEYLEERSGGMLHYLKSSCSTSTPSKHQQHQQHQTPKACKQLFSTPIKQKSISTLSFQTEQPDLIKEVLANAMKTSRTESDLMSLQNLCTESLSSSHLFSIGNDEKCRFNGRKFGHKMTKSEYHIKISGDNKKKMKKKKKENFNRNSNSNSNSSCVSQ